MAKKSDKKKKKKDKRERAKAAKAAAEREAATREGSKDADGRGASERKKRQIAKAEAAEAAHEPRDFSYTQNREISWLRFDDRMLDLGLDETIPLFERLKFVSIFGSNLDEWFKIRIGGLSDLTLLKHQPRDNKSNETPSQQIENAMAILPGLIRRQEEAFAKIEIQLASAGLVRVPNSELTDADLAELGDYFDDQVSPIISPMIIDPRHPFPNLRTDELYVACSLDGPDEQGLLGIIEVPSSLPRIVELSPHHGAFRYVLVEDAIISRLPSCFGDYAPTSAAVIRVTRNADIDPDGEGVEEEEDYRQHMKKVLKKRQRLQAVRLEVEGDLDQNQVDFIAGELSLAKNRVFNTAIPLDLGYIYGLERHIPDRSHARITYEPFEPQLSPMVDPSLPMRPQVEDHDVLLFYPYESMDPLLRLLREASSDDACISIKITLYRVAKQSRLCESLIAAAENGKEVTVLMELRARFDEANNIAWADRLESAGCTVIYGEEGYKVHSKICQITYHDQGSIKRITCLGTGNFNEKTARLYSDFMLLTAHEGIAEDGNVFFRNLSLGNLRGTYKYLGVAPVGLKPLVMRGLNREIERAHAGQPAQVFMKMNSLTDRDVIDKIAEACQAGVRVILIVRGICCIKADVPGRTDGLVVRQLVGRFLEHARVYAFGADTDTVYLSSADMMTRNTERRVEIAYPVLDEVCRSLVVSYINIQLADNDKARQLTSKGTWEPVATLPGDPKVNAQDILLALAYRRAHMGDGADEFITPVSKIMPRMPVALIRRAASLPSIASYAVDEGEAQAEKQAAGWHPEARKAARAVREGTVSANAQKPQADAAPANEAGAPDAEGGKPDAEAPAADAASAEAPDAANVEDAEPDAAADAEAAKPAAAGAEPAEPAAQEAAAEAVAQPVEANEPAPAPKPEAEASGQPAPAPKPEAATEPVIEVSAREIEGGAASSQASAEDASSDESATTVLMRPRPNRLAVGLRLIGLGLREIVSGTLTRQARQKGQQKER